MRDVATMKEKAQAWIGNLLGWGRRRQSGSAEKLYAEAVRLSRRPEFFQKYGVADDVDGRFDALSLMVIIVMRRLQSLDEGGKALSQDLFDSMFADMDLSLREMGAGDIGVSKRVRVMAEAFMGRLNTYVAAIDEDDRDLWFYKYILDLQYLSKIHLYLNIYVANQTQNHVNLVNCLLLKKKQFLVHIC